MIYDPHVPLTTPVPHIESKVAFFPLCLHRKCRTRCRAGTLSAPEVGSADKPGRPPAAGCSRKTLAPVNDLVNAL